MKQKWAAILLSLCILLPLCFLSAGAALSSSKLSFAIDIIQTRTKLIKGGLRGSKVTFSEKDFAEVFGKKKFDFITIDILPKKVSGVLTLSGLEVLEGQSISKDKLSELVFLPMNEAGDCSFTFSRPDEKQSFECALVFFEEERAVLTAENISIETFKNVAVFETLSTAAQDGIRYEIVSGCKRGVISLVDGGSGQFVYRPKTNFIGKDKFSYRIKDAYGNYSEVKTVDIRVTKAGGNLYFRDLEANPRHNAAISACLSGAMGYQKDENGLPVFRPQEEISMKEFLEAVYLAASGKKSPDTVEASAKEDGVIRLPYDPEEKVCFEEAVSIIYSVLVKDTAGAKEVWLHELLKDSESPLAALAACDIVKESTSIAPEARLTRAECADLVCSLLELKAR